MAREKPQIIRKFLREYGGKMGYDASAFPNKILSQVSALQRKGVDIELTIGIRKFGGRWFSLDNNKLIRWLDNNIKPGPRFGVETIPDNTSKAWFLEQAKGIYNLRAILNFFETQVVNFYKVRNAAKKIEKTHGNARSEIGAFIKNDIWVVEFPKFGVYLRENEPEIWSEHKRLHPGDGAE